MGNENQRSPGYSLSEPVRFPETQHEQRLLLVEAWFWLARGGFPYDVRSDSRYIFAMSELGDVVGVAEMRDYDATSRWLQLLYVSPSHRLQRVGTRLLQACLRHTPTMRLGLGTAADNVGMAALAKSVGMEDFPRVEWWSRGESK